MLAQLEVDFWDVEACLVVEWTRLDVGWIQLDGSTKEAHGKVEVVRAENERVVAEAKVACENALAKKEAFAKHYEEMETSLKAR
ncbi:hypothetical protein D1007_24982 [Hordeum vulgare]|nr:hypothetical protein D1007_24982 [Hordeum vulgare]